MADVAGAQQLEDARPHLWTVAEWVHSAIAQRTELVAGVVYDVAPRSPAQSHAATELLRRLTLGDVGRYEVYVREAVALAGADGLHAPEVDLAILRPGRAWNPLPTPADTVGVVIVSDAGYRDDRRVKVPLLVDAGLQTWVVNIRERRVELYAGGRETRFALDAAAMIADVAVPVEALFTT